jgi:pilus assembly protein Flp/PilA
VCILIERDNPGHPMRNLVLRFVNDQRGATAIEYALIAAGISIVIVVAVNSIGTSLNSTFSSISSQLGGGSS